MNLLPGGYKKEFKLEVLRRFGVFVTYYLAWILLIAMLLLLPSYFALSLQLKEINRQFDIVSEGPEVKKMNDGIRNINEANRVLSEFKGLEKSRRSFFELIKEVTAGKPSDILITSINYKAQDTGDRFELRGKKDSRDAFIALITVLERSGRYDVVPDPGMLDAETFVVTVTLRQ